MKIIKQEEFIFQQIHFPAQSILAFCLTLIFGAGSVEVKSQINWEGQGRGLHYLEIKDNVGKLHLTDLGPVKFNAIHVTPDTILCNILFENYYPFYDSIFYILKFNDRLDSLSVRYGNGITFYKKELSPYHSRFYLERI